MDRVSDPTEIVWNNKLWTLENTIALSQSYEKHNLLWNPIEKLYKNKYKQNDAITLRWLTSGHEYISIYYAPSLRRKLICSPVRYWKWSQEMFNKLIMECLSVFFSAPEQCFEKKFGWWRRDLNNTFLCLKNACLNDSVCEETHYPATKS